MKRKEVLEAIDPVDLGLLQAMRIDPTVRVPVKIVVHEAHERLVLQENLLLAQDVFPNHLELYARETLFRARAYHLQVSEVTCSEEEWYLGGRLPDGRDVMVHVHAVNRDLFSRN